MSKNQQYIELTTEERKIIENGDIFSEYIKSPEMAKNVNVVEVGWNEKK